MIELSNDDLLFIKTLSTENLIELINIYNDIITIYNSIAINNL
jgi:hypothetical protein